MADIKIKIETYGAVERHLPAELIFTCAENSLVSEVLKQISDEYPDSLKLLDKCACAIGDEIISRRHGLANSCTLVLLSPVAGG
ncbi:ThiS family protein [Acinetobacter sp. BIGb0102]|uniref:MoaD/ThiS family protein n=1 Tax=Acinetobacter sp. BIGb0102 TaxID=2485131 RepID=UPI000F508A04|nr:MoaD/ThiS family protein [Acinetobacter sp. BIGb0102]RPE28298.1 ThiS family protein [Acinetobacter sp. BIGb0102]